MVKIFQNILQMSIYGSVAIIAVMILRKCFHRLPKRITALFWLVPGFRLLCPLNFKTIFSVMNIAGLSGNAEETINQTTNAVNRALEVKPRPIQVHPGAGTVHELPQAAAFDVKTIIAFVWVAGMITILAYLGIKTIRMLQVLRSARKVSDKNYYESDEVDTSFVLGVFRPRIYMQSGLSKREEAYILLHEQTHIRYRDHLTRIIGVLTVCMHWFNPLVWIAFAKMCTDLEMRCDEAVIDQMGAGIRKEYCRSIVRHAMDRGEAQRGLYAAFAGDNYNGKEIKQRINHMANYKKVSVIATMIIVAFAMALTVALSTRAQGKEEAEVQQDRTEASSEEVELTGEIMTADAAEAVKAEDVTGAKTAERGKPVSVPGNLLLDMTEEECLDNYGKTGMEIPADVEYSDEGRPYSKTYDFRTNPILKAFADYAVKEGFEIDDPDIEYLDKDGNVQVGRELYTFGAYKENGDQIMSLRFNIVTDEYARESFSEIVEKDGFWYSPDMEEEESFPNDPDAWYWIRVYDTKTGIMLDAQGTEVYDWKAAFDVISEFRR